MLCRNISICRGNNWLTGFFLGGGLLLLVISYTLKYIVYKYLYYLCWLHVWSIFLWNINICIQYWFCMSSFFYPFVNKDNILNQSVQSPPINAWTYKENKYNTLLTSFRLLPYLKIGLKIDKHVLIIAHYKQFIYIFTSHLLLYLGNMKAKRTLSFLFITKFTMMLALSVSE